MCIIYVRMYVCVCVLRVCNVCVCILRIIYVYVHVFTIICVYDQHYMYNMSCHSELFSLFVLGSILYLEMTFTGGSFL